MTEMRYLGQVEVDSGTLVISGVGCSSIVYLTATCQPDAVGSPSRRVPPREIVDTISVVRDSCGGYPLQRLPSSSWVIQSGTLPDPIPTAAPA